MTTINPPTHVPDDETATATCPYCERPFTSRQRRNLHVGTVHPEACTDEEREHYEGALDEESDNVFLYHVKIIATLMGLYGGMVIVYMVVLSA